MLRRNSLVLNWPTLQPWLAGILVVLTSAWFADTLRESFEPWAQQAGLSNLVITLIYFVLLLLSLTWLYQTRQMLFRPQTRYLNDLQSPEPRQNLVLFLSDLDLRRGDLCDGIPTWLVLTDDLEKDMSTLAAQKAQHPPWRWEMPLRAIKHHSLDVLPRLQAWDSWISKPCQIQPVLQALPKGLTSQPLIY